MKHSIRQKVVRFLLKIIETLVPAQRIHPMQQETETKMLADMWASQPVREYIANREQYLKDQAIERFIQGKLEDARGFSGQMIEVRAFKARLMAAWFHTKRTPVTAQK